MKTNPNDTLTGDTKNEWKNGHSLTSDNAPLTKREYFAAMAMQGMLAGKPWGNEVDLCEMAVQLSTILIEELNKDDK